MNIIEHINSNKNYIGFIKFDNNDKEYCFFTKMSDLKNGDKVVVDTVNGLLIVTFIRYLTNKDENIERLMNRTYKWILTKIDLRDYPFINKKKPNVNNIILK